LHFKKSNIYFVDAKTKSRNILLVFLDLIIYFKKINQKIIFEKLYHCIFMILDLMFSVENSQF